MNLIQGVTIPWGGPSEDWGVYGGKETASRASATCRLFLGSRVPAFEFFAVRKKVWCALGRHVAG